jgi:hypothetical protein
MGGGKSFENSFYYCSDLFGNQKQAIPLCIMVGTNVKWTFFKVSYKAIHAIYIFWTEQEHVYMNVISMYVSFC